MAILLWGCLAAAAQPAGTSPLPASPPIRVHGKPFFPVGLYHYPRHDPKKDSFKAMAAEGIDCFLMPVSSTKEELDAAQANGIRVVLVIGDLMNFTGSPEQVAEKKKTLAERIGPESAAFRHPAVVALEGPDEPLWNVKYTGQRDSALPEMATWGRPPAQRREIQAFLTGMRDGYAEIRRLCGDRYTVWINFAPREDEEELRWFTDLPPAAGAREDGRRTADVFGTDIYPAPDGGGNNGWIRGRLVPSPAAVGAFTEKLRRAVSPYPIYMVLQGSGIEEWDPEAVRAGRSQRRPTFEEQQFMAYDAIVHGAMGILWWGPCFIEDDSLYWRHIAGVSRGVRSLAPVLAEGSDWPEVRPGMQEISVLGKIHGGDRVVIATNNNPVARAPTGISVPGWRGERAFSLLDGREVPVADGVLRDSLPPLGVGVYTDGTSLFQAFGRPSPGAAARRPMRLLFALSVDLDPFKGKAPAEVAAALAAAGVDGVVQMPHDPALMDALHGAGLKAYAEITCFAGTEAWKTHPGTRPVTAEGTPYGEGEGYGGICLNQESYVRDLLDRIDRLLGEAPWDGLWLDFIRWPGKWEEKEPKLVPVCFCDTCLARFAADRAVRCPAELAATKDKASWILQHHAAAWAAWKCDRVADVVARIRERLKAKRGADAILGIFGVPMGEKDFDGALHRVYGQDWAKLGPYVDVFSPMVYHIYCGRPLDWIAQVASEVARRSGRAVWPIVQSGSVPSALPVEEFEKALREGLKAPSAGVMVFTTRDTIQEGKWETMARVYREAGAAAGEKSR